MSVYSFDEELFKKNFSVKENKPVDTLRLNHTTDKQFKLFPYKATPKTQSPVVTDLSESISEFFRRTLEISAEPVSFEELCSKIQDNIDIEDDDIDFFRDVISSLFFKDNNFYGYNIGLYPYQTSVENKSAERIGEYLYCILDLNENDKANVKNAENQYSFNVLEKMVVDSIDVKVTENQTSTEKYFKVITSIQDEFKNDFEFMLSSGMTSIEDLSNLLSFYYFYYISQVCITLDQYGNGSRSKLTPLYFALDWEKISKNRKCCEEGWAKLQNNISKMFSHAIALEILNQNDSPMMDYIDFRELADISDDNDIDISNEIKKAESLYISFIGDCNSLKDIPEEQSTNRTDAAIRHLFKCISTQFEKTDRKRASQFYSEKFSDFCKSRFVKNRKKSGLTLNLTERDIIFLTKLAIQHDEKIRLNDLYKEYEKRGVYLDSTSKSLLQEFFTRLNLIDKKSDSGDAQYVKRIL